MEKLVRAQLVALMLCLLVVLLAGSALVVASTPAWAVAPVKADTLSGEESRVLDNGLAGPLTEVRC